MSKAGFFSRRVKDADNQGTVTEELPGMGRERIGASIFMLPPAIISPNPSQPRRFFTEDAIARLADSIRNHGIIQPLSVRRHGDGYELVAGERRLRAARLLGLDEVPCVLVEADDCESAHLAIIENIQRENLNMFEQASAMLQLMKIHCLTQEKIAAQLSCSQSYVANKLRLLRLGVDERTEILENSLSERHARALLRIKDADARKSVMRTVIKRELNVAATEEYIDRLLEAEKTPAADGAGGVRKLVIKDLRLFYNTLDRAVETMRLSGIPVETRRRESGDDTEITILVPRKAVSNE